MRVLIVDPFPESALAELRALRLDVEHRTGLDEAALVAAVREVGVLVVRSTVVSAKVIQAAARLNLIVRAGAGVNTIDVRAASARAIYVANCPGKNATAVAELTMGLILALDRRIVDATDQLRAGKWNKKEFSKAAGIHGRTIGIAGLGSIGREVLTRAHAFGLVAHAWSRSLTPEKAEELGVAYASSLEQLASRVDILTLHLPLGSGTKKVVGREVLQAMKDGAMLINTSRAEIVDDAALREAVTAKKLRVGVDVLEGEPSAGEAEFKSALLALPGVVATPHIGASTDQAQSAIARETVRIVRSFLAEGTVPNVVNISATSPARSQLVVRHLDRVGVLANVLAVIKRHQINVEEVSNTIFEGAEAACAKMRLAERPTDDCLTEISGLGDVLHVDCVPLA
ncbi:MAG TPA: phosphoglycerate dehydrogenase [Polyangiaceae bacterium]|nr:phosphoglycerate dehydrogenase [Polyangiaceae bacterium]